MELDREEARPTKSQTGRWALAVVSGVMALCLLAGVACVAFQPAMQRWPLEFGYSMTFCLVGPPHPQIGVRWMSPYFSSALPPFGGPGAGCYATPYLPFLPQRGEILFPP